MPKSQKAGIVFPNDIDIVDFDQNGTSIAIARQKWQSAYHFSSTRCPLVASDDRIVRTGHQAPG